MNSTISYTSSGFVRRSLPDVTKCYVQDFVQIAGCSTHDYNRETNTALPAPILLLDAARQTVRVAHGLPELSIKCQKFNAGHNHHLSAHLSTLKYDFHKNGFICRDASPSKRATSDHVFPSWPCSALTFFSKKTREPIMSVREYRRTQDCLATE